MKAQIEKVTSNTGHTSSSKSEQAESSSVTVQSQYYGNEYVVGDDDYTDFAYDDTPAEDTYYNQQPQYSSRPALHPSKYVHRNPRQNPPDEYGNLTRCSFCHSTYHWLSRCLDAPRQSSASHRGTGTRRGGQGRANYPGYGNMGQDRYIWLDTSMHHPNKTEMEYQDYEYDLDVAEIV